MQVKKCSKCKGYKDISCFDKNKYRKDGLISYCKECNKEYRKNSITIKLSCSKYHKKYLSNPEKRKHRDDYLREYHKRPYVIEKKKKYEEKNYMRFKERRRVYMKKYNKEHHSKLMKENPIFRLIQNMRTRVRKAIKRGVGKKNNKFYELTGCSIEFLVKYIESLFQEGMSWDNYGKWHIDHIIPCNSFNLIDFEQQKKCFNYTNLRPLWAQDNLRRKHKN